MKRDLPEIKISDDPITQQVLAHGPWNGRVRIAVVIKDGKVVEQRVYLTSLSPRKEGVLDKEM